MSTVPMGFDERVHILESAKGAYAYLVEAREKLLVDTSFPWQGRAIVEELVSMKVALTDIKHILLTHYDIDHVGNAVLLQRLSGAILWASATEIPYITGRIPRPGFKKYLPRILGYEAPCEIRAYEDGFPLAEIELAPTPGHTPGHACILFGDLLFAGDIVENHRGNLRPYPAFWNWNDAMMRDSIRELSKLPFRWICPAHGRPLPRHDAWEEMMVHLA